MGQRGIFGLTIFLGVSWAISCLPAGNAKDTRAIAEEPPAVIINELAWAGSSASSDDEWIELKNTTPKDIDLAGWQITKYTASKKQQLMISIANNPTDPASTTISAGGYFLIANNGPEHDFGNEKRSRINTDPNIIDAAVSLADSNLWVRIYNGEWDNAGELIDSAGDGGEAFAGDGSAKTSMERDDEYGPGNEATSWHAATAAINLDVGTLDKGTPKSANSLAALSAPIVSAVHPTNAEIDTILEMTSIEGANFSREALPQVELRNHDQLITATGVHVLTSGLIDKARFDLHGATVGDWDMVVTNPDGQSGTLLNAMELIEPEEETDTPQYSTKIIINEVYPKPSTNSNEEFIELYNPETTAISLTGWQLDDQSPGGSAPYTMDDDCVIPAQGYLSLSKNITHISLNDTGDSVRLVQPNGTVISQVIYGATLTGQSYARIDDQWRWTIRVTKNAKNIWELDNNNQDSNEAVAGEQSSIKDNPHGIELELSIGQVSSSAVTLEWQLDEWGYIDEVEIFISPTANKLGKLNRIAAANQREAEVTGLLPNTKYFFTITGDYNAYTATSNQVSTTTRAGTPVQKINSGTITGQLIITELLPNPGGGDSEWIEIYNPTDQAITITGWQLVDKSNRRYIFNAIDLIDAQTMTDSDEDEESGEYVIEPGQYLLLDQDITGIHLNNSGGEEVRLIDADDNLVDTASYSGTAKRDYAYVLAPNQKWFWTTEATPGVSNSISFAGEMEDGDNYLTPSGTPIGGRAIGWLSLLLSAIILVRAKRYVKTNYQK